MTLVVHQIVWTTGKLFTDLCSGPKLITDVCSGPRSLRQASQQHWGHLGNTNYRPTQTNRISLSDGTQNKHNEVLAHSWTASPLRY